MIYPVHWVVIIVKNLFLEVKFPQVLGRQHYVATKQQDPRLSHLSATTLMAQI